jgi:hypothetical protein
MPNSCEQTMASGRDSRNDELIQEEQVGLSTANRTSRSATVFVVFL